MDDLLFSQYDLRRVIENHEQKMLAEIDAIDGNRLLNTSVDDLCDYFEEEYIIHVPRLDESGIQVDQGETKVDINRRRWDYDILDRDGPFYVTGTKVTFFIPFQEDSNLLRRIVPGRCKYCPA